MEWAGEVCARVDEHVGAIGDWCGELHRAAHAPHVKRQLRISAYGDLIESGRFGDPNDTFMWARNEYVKLKLKPLEWAKPGKIGRIVCDMGTPASLRAGTLFESIKKAMAREPLRGSGFKIHIVSSPNVEQLTALFRTMEGNNVALVFSDDMAISIHFIDVDGQIRQLFAEVDISGCDASQGPASWKLLGRCVPAKLYSQFRAIYRQAMAPCRVGHGKGKLVFQPLVPREYSGILATTCLNNCASVSILIKLLSDFPLLGKEQCRAELQRRLEACGWRCTLVWADDFERMTFLKHSPIRGIDGMYYATLNLGVMLRALGQKSYDLPGRGDLSSRGYDFNCALVSGFRHAGDSSFLRTLRSKFSKDMEPYHNSNITKHVELGDIVLPPLSDDSLCLRYSLPLALYEEMLCLLRLAKHGDVINCAASRRILDVDYAL